MKAYTYSIKNIPTNTIYYGVRKSSDRDLGITYFSSSKLVRRMISEQPLENFEFKIRRTFDSYEEARKHEFKILTRLKVVSNYRFLNQAISAPRICSKDSVEEQTRKKNISKAMAEVWKRPEYRDMQRLTTEEYSERGRIGALKRAENYKNGTLKKKPKKPPSYKDILIQKGDKTKTIKSNQYPAYAKSGWIRV